MHTSGILHIGDTSSTIPIQRILFDTGAIHANYINSSVIAAHYSILSPYLQPTRASVTLADKVTKISVSSILKVPLSIQGTTRMCYFYVLESMTTDIIIGLPSILYHYYDVFLKLLDSARQSLVHSLSINNENAAAEPTTTFSALTVEETSISVLPHPDPTLRDPWTKFDDHAPEDLDSYEPSMFSHALYFMEMTVEEAQKEYFNLFDTHVAPEFISSVPKIITLLRTKGLQVFVPQNWNGINGIEPIKFQFSNDIPKVHKPKVRPVNPRLFADTHAEWLRLLEYHLVLCDSPFVSNLVVAPKATKPFVRLCGDYVFVNKYITAGYFVIPPIPHVLEKIANFSIYVDLDLVNAFHQLPLDEATSMMLAIITPWGTARPKFLPEGVKPASEILQRVVHELFHDFSDWLIYQFDNLLILAHTYQDAYDKLDKVLTRCIQRNVFLKFSKSYIGFNKVHFFGYDCQHRSYALSQDRKETISKIPFPQTLKQMQSFLGAALFFKSFVPHFSTLTAPLYDTTKKDFPWSKPELWKHDYARVFEEFKDALLHATANFYPDYSLQWILRTDASLYGIGAVLLQVFITDTGETQYQPIAFASKKFSDQAMRWTTIEQEAYGIYFAVHHFSYYLRCKTFIIETDHNNLIWIEASLVPKVIRWRIYLQSFSFLLRHIPGKHNAVADWLSRLHSISLGEYYPSVADTDDMDLNLHEAADHDLTACTLLQRLAAHKEDYFPDEVIRPEVHDPRQTDEALFFLPDDSPKQSTDIPATNTDIPVSAAALPREVSLPTALPDAVLDPLPATLPIADTTVHVEDLTPLQMLHRAHNARVGHSGIKTTHQRLNDLFPGHGISLRQIDDFISTCPTCQKDRLHMTTALKPVVRHIKPPHQRSAVGVDILGISPPDKDGHVCFIVVVNQFTKFAALYPSTDHHAESLARALFLYFTTYGVCEEIHSDPGADLTSEVIDHLHKWFGIPHIFSIVDRPQSNGVEGSNKQIVRHLRALAHDERLTHDWGDPINVAILQYLLNMVDSSETGIIPMHAHFGSADATYHRMPLTLTDAQRTHAYVRLLDQQLQYLIDKSKQYQANLIAQRIAATPAERQNIYQPGDYVLVKMNADGNRPPTKLSPRYFGPYEVIRQHKNDVECKHVIRHRTLTVHVERCKPFYGNAQAAHEAALRDYDEYDVVAIDAYAGDPLKRQSMEFRVIYASGSSAWLPYSAVSQNAFLDVYARSRSDLLPLRYATAAEANKVFNRMKKDVIDTVQPGDTVYVSLRSYGASFYNALTDISDRYDKDYVVEYKYIKWANSKHTRIEVYCEVFEETFPEEDLVFVTLYGSNKLFDALTMVLVDSSVIVQYPDILPNSKSKQALLRKHKRRLAAPNG